MPAMECLGLAKRFSDLIAVDHISFEVQQNEIFGLLGPNGAGKTTLTRMLTTILPPTEGTAIVAGHDIIKESKEVRKTIDVVTQRVALDVFLSVFDNFDIYGRIQGIPKKERKSKIDQLLNDFGLEEKKRTKVELLSGGLMRRLQVARAFMCDHEILFLDEPTLGLDPQAKRKVWDFIQDFSRHDKKTIIITTHDMIEADYLCDRIGIIDHGKIIALESPKALKNRVSGDVIEIRLGGNAGSLKSKISTLDYVKTVQDTNDGLSVEVADGDSIMSDLIQYITAKGGVIRNVAVHKPTLEDAFIDLTGRRLR